MLVWWTSVESLQESSIFSGFLLDNFQEIDDKSIRRQIFLTTFKKEIKVRELSGSVPITLSMSWDYIIINLAEVTYQLFKTKYVKTLEIQVSINRLYRQQQCCYKLTLTHCISFFLVYFPLDLDKMSDTKSVFLRQTILSGRAVMWPQSWNFRREQSGTQHRWSDGREVARGPSWVRASGPQ